jgi:predicted metal-dependent hydrolase
MTIDYQVLHSRRKTLALQVRHGQVFVRAPYHVDEQFINSFIQKKEAWLRAKITEQTQTADLCCNFTQGAKLFLFGQQVRLNIVLSPSSKKPNVSLSKLAKGKQELTIALPIRSQTKLMKEPQLASRVKKQIELYFKEQAQNIILPKVEHYSQLTQLSPKAIKIRQYRARWGSCNSKGELSFNYLLMMLPVHVIDYVIIHELCHLQHLNHSKNFWQLVATYFPNYKQAKEWVKTNQSALLWRTPVS